MKTKRSSRIISLLLTVIMLVGMVPVSSLAVAAETITTSTATTATETSGATSTPIPSNAEWTVIGGPGTTESDTELYEQLKTAMGAGGTGTRYIRLGEDIDYTKTVEDSIYVTPDTDYTIWVFGDVVFDLNGYRLDVTFSQPKAKRSMHCSLFHIGQRSGVTNGNLTVVDSRGKGEIHTNGYIRDKKETSIYDLCHVFNIFELHDNSRLVINASGATFRCGRSKEQYFAFLAGYDGCNAYNQICGSVVVLHSNTDLTVAGGKLQARGYNSISDGNEVSQVERCAAIYVKNEKKTEGKKSYWVYSKNININIIDGTFYGKGCADALAIGSESECSAYNRNVTVRSGVFDVFKLAYVVWGNAINCAVYVEGSYGTIGIHDSALDPDNADIIIGGHNYSEDEDKATAAASDTHKTTTVKPKSDNTHPDDRISVESANGIGSWNGEGSFVIKATNGRAYFSDSDKAFLVNDLQPSTYRYYIWIFTLYNPETGEKCDAKPIQISSFNPDEVMSVDLADFKSSSGDGNYDFTTDGVNSYKVMVAVEEIWSGHHRYNTIFYNWFYFEKGSGIDMSEAARAFDFVLTHNADANSYTIYTDNEDGMEYYLMEILGEHPDCELTCNASYSYCTLDSGGNTVKSPGQLIGLRSVSGGIYEYGEDITFTIPEAHGGPIYVTVDYIFSSDAGMDILSVTHKTYALGSISYDIIGNDTRWDGNAYTPVVEETGLVDSNVPVDLNGCKNVIIKPNITADMVKIDLADPTTDDTFDTSTIKWQFYTESDDNGNPIWNDVPDYEIIDYDVDGVTLPCVKTARTAVYRMYYERDGQRFYSPQNMLFKGTRYDENRVVIIEKGKNFTGVYGKGENKLYLDITNADWYTGGCSITKILVTMTDRPNYSEIATNLKTVTDFTVSEDGLVEIVNTDYFFDSTVGAKMGYYTFLVRVRGTNSDGTTYSATGSYKVEYSDSLTTDLDLYVNGTAIYEHDGINIPYILPANTNVFNFSYGYYPQESWGAGVVRSSIKWTSSDPSVLKIDASTGKETSLTPGTVTVSCSWKDTSGNIYTSAARISVPIRNFEIEEIDYSQYVGKKLSEIDTTKVAKIKSVWSYGGKKVTTDVDRYMTIELTSADGWGAGSNHFRDTTVSYNNNTRYGYTLKPKVADGYFFVVEAEADDDEIEYYVDTGTLRCRGLDNGELLSVESYGATTEWNTPYRVSIDHKNKTYTAEYENYMYIRLTHQPVIEDPDAVYLDEVNITVSESAVGDNRYEGTDYKKMNEFLVLNVSGELGELKTDDSCSHVSKLDTTNMRGTGKPYDDASSEERGDLALEYMSVFNTNSDYSEWYKPTKTYENGIYVHDVRLSFDSDSADGTKVYLAKDAKVFVNGRLLDYAGVSYDHSYSDDESCVSFKYYFDVGEVSTVSSIEIDGLEPMQGDLPYEAEDAILSASFADGSDASNKVTVESVQWFVDANKNGVFDEGEGVEAKFKKDGTYNADESTLWWDGTFLPGVEYSARIELGIDSEALRFASDMAIDCGGSEPVFDTPTSFIVKFAGDYLIRKISIKTAEGEAAAYPEGRDPLGLANACEAFKIVGVAIYKNNGYSDNTANIHLFYGGENFLDKTLSKGTYFYEFNIYRNSSDYLIDDNVIVLVNGKTYGDEFAPGRNEIASQGNETARNCIYPFYTPGVGGVTVSGTAKSFGSDTAEVTIQLIESGMSEPAYEAVVKGNSASYSIASVAAGTYTMKVMKKNHVTREYTVTVGSSNVTQDVKIHLLGDIDGNGTVTIMDAMRANSHARGVTLLTDYALKCADVVGTDGKVTVMDAMRINAHARGTAMLW